VINQIEAERACAIVTAQAGNLSRAPIAGKVSKHHRLELRSRVSEHSYLNLKIRAAGKLLQTFLRKLLADDLLQDWIRRMVLHLANVGQHSWWKPLIGLVARFLRRRQREAASAGLR
jgi:hypothetical protein